MLSRRLAKFNRNFTNRLTLPLAGWMPGFGVITHVGRKSGQTYRTPINVFGYPKDFLVALTYGTNTDWIKNVFAAGGCQLVTRGKHYNLSEPSIVHDGSRSKMPFVVGLILGWLAVADFLRFDRIERTNN